MKIQTMIAKSLASSAIGLALLCPVLAHAQGAPADTAASPGTPAGAQLDDIVVTAQKRSENLQKVPVSITALTADALETRQIQNVVDLQTQVPSLIVGQYYGASLITLRGISTGVTSGSEDPSVATHINGVYQPRSRSIDSALIDLERVEVLSGPQGTLYGRNATGGVVNYILRGPTAKFEGEVGARVANYGRYAVQGRVSGPLSDNVGYLVSGLYDDQTRGFTRNLLKGAPNKRLEDSRTAGGRIALEFRPTSEVTINIDNIYMDTDETPASLAFAPPLSPISAAFLGPQSYRPREIITEIEALSRTKYFQTSGTINWEVTPDVTLKSITAYQTLRNKQVIDLDSSAVASDAPAQQTRSNTFTQELNLNTVSFDDRLKSVFGIFYFDDNLTANSLTTFNVPGFLADYIAHTKIKTKSVALFTDQTLTVAEGLRLQAGIRYNYDKKVAEQSVDFGGPICPLATNKRVAKAWTPRFGAQYDMSDDVMVYGQWSKGFKSGGFVANTCYNGFDPESIKGPEVGIKTQFLDRRVRLNLSAYYYDYKNIQVQRVVGVGQFSVVNAAAARIYGIEGQLNAALTPQLKLDMTGMLQSAKYTNFQNCNQAAFAFACSSAATTSLVDVSGNWLNRAAPYSLNAGLEYAAEMADGGSLTLRGETFFSGRVHFDEFASPLATQKAYSLQNAYVTYTPGNDRFTFRAYVKNIANTNYRISSFFQSAIQLFSGNYGAPRTYGVEARAKF